MPRDPIDALRLTVETEPGSEDIRFLEERLYEFNVEATGITDGNLLGVFVRGSDGSVVGGAFGWTWGGTCYIRYLFIPANMRRQGLGTEVMRAVEKEAKSRSCRQIVLETHEFQAPGFYQKLGFEAVSRVADYPRGHDYMTLVATARDEPQARPHRPAIHREIGTRARMRVNRMQLGRST
jgi:GNAT superfamily N-acetyltransferase